MPWLRRGVAGARAFVARQTVLRSKAPALLYGRNDHRFVRFSQGR